jgi:hypothetical protein
MPDREREPEADQPKPPARSAGGADDAQAPAEASEAGQAPAEPSEAAQAPDEASEAAQSPAKPSEAAQAPEPSSPGSRKKAASKQRKGVKRKAKQQEDDPGEDELRKDEPREDEPRKGKRREGKQRKGKQRKDQQRATRRDRLDAAGKERPRFLLSFPDDPQLERLIEAFERGDYALVRREARRVAKRARDPEVRAAARELRRRIDPDPLAVYLLLAAVALLLFLIVWAYHVQ